MKNRYTRIFSEASDIEPEEHPSTFHDEALDISLCDDGLSIVRDLIESNPEISAKLFELEDILTQLKSNEQSELH